MKRIFALAFAAILTLSLAFSCSGNDEERAHVLKVYNWADYIDESLIPEFEQWYKENTGEEVKVIYQLFDINEIVLAKIEKGKDDYDVICPSDYMIERMLKKGLLLPIDKHFDDVPNYIDNNVSPFIQKLIYKLDVGGERDINPLDYTAGYMWGTTGLMYNTEKVDKEDVKTWNVLNNPKYKGGIYMKDAFRDVYCPILIYLKQKDLNEGSVTLDKLMYDDSDESIALVENYLKGIAPNVAGWEVDFGKEMMSKGNGMIDFTWSGDAAWAMEEAAEVGVNLDYIIPEEGSNVWFDGWCIPKYAKNIKAARYFINFMCKTENSIRNMDEIGYVSVVGGQQMLEYQEDPEAYPAIDASYFFGPEADSVHINPVQYPDYSIMEKCATMHDTGDRTDKMLEMWSRVKGDNVSSFTYIVIAIAVIAVIASLFMVNHSMKRRKKIRRHASRHQNK